MSSPESVSSRMASFGSSTAIWKISLRFFSPQRQEIHSVELLMPCGLANRVKRRAEEIDVRDARDFHRILESHEDARARAVFRRKRQQVVRVIADFAFRNGVNVAAGEHLG